MKKDSPPNTDRLSPFMIPPWVLVSMSTPCMETIAPASALICSLADKVMVATAKDGENLISVCMEQVSHLASP